MTAVWSVIPLILSSFTTALSVSAHAPALMWALRQPWENTPTLHTFLKIDETKRLDWSSLEGGEWMEYGARSAAQKRLVGDVSTAENVFLPYTKYGHSCEEKKRKLLQFRFPSLTI